MIPNERIFMIKKMETLHAVMLATSAPENYGADPYLHGFANGLRYSWSILLSEPMQWLPEPKDGYSFHNKLAETADNSEKIKLAMDELEDKIRKNF
jgi:hypothetical protein